MNPITTHVQVTREHIARGVVRNCERCPVALAVIGALGGLFASSSTVDVEADSISFYPGDGRIWRAKTPVVANDFIVDFDRHEDVGPIEFTLIWRVTEGPRGLL